MDERRYDVVFRGELREGEDPGAVRARLAALFKSGPEAIERLFSGQAIVIRRAVDEATAARYRDALHRAGARCHMAPAAAPPSGASPANGAPGETPDAARGDVPPPSPDLATATILPAGTPFTQLPPPAPPEYTFDGLTLAAAGGDLTEHRPAPTPDIDTSHLSVAPSGADVDSDR